MGRNRKESKTRELLKFKLSLGCFCSNISQHHLYRYLLLLLLLIFICNFSFHFSNFVLLCCILFYYYYYYYYFFFGGGVSNLRISWEVQRRFRRNEPGKLREEWEGVNYKTGFPSFPRYHFRPLNCRLNFHQMTEKPPATQATDYFSFYEDWPLSVRCPPSFYWDTHLSRSKT